jgi:hypothetical protein
MQRKFSPSRAAVRASIKEYPTGCCTYQYQVINLRHAFVLGYAAGQQAMRKLATHSNRAVTVPRTE